MCLFVGYAWRMDQAATEIWYHQIDGKIWLDGRWNERTLQGIIFTISLQVCYDIILYFQAVVDVLKFYTATTAETSSETKFMTVSKKVGT